jgi:N-acyl-D-amino-acid deacylase
MSQMARRRRRIWWRALSVGLIAIILVAFALFRFVRRPEHDLLVLNGLVHDGSGSAPYVASVGIDGDIITAIYPRGARHALIWPGGRQTIDARGSDVAPGFIDTHTHADLNILGSSGAVRANNFIGQGITTIVTGNCGRSPLSVGRFARTIAFRGINVNVATLIGLNSVRTEVMKSSTVAANSRQIGRMCQLVSLAMQEGAVGVSTGAAYVPGRFASEEETVAQLKVAGRYGGMFATHLRDEGTAIEQSVDEALRQSTEARLPLLISHFKIVGPANCGKYSKLAARLEGARAMGARIYTDQYPYEASSSSLDLYLPDWFVGTRGAARHAILTTPAGQSRLMSSLRGRIGREGFEDWSFAYVASHEHDSSLAGSSLAEIAHRTGTPVTVDSQTGVMIELLRHGGAQMVYHNICRDPILQIAAQPTSMFGSDSAIRYAGGDYLPHPRGWGTFPRVLAYLVRRRGVVALDEAIRRMTSLPATVFRLERRGLIRRGYYADLVIFDASTIADRATYKRPLLAPRGIEYVIVNGKVAAAPSLSPSRRFRGVPDILPVLAGRFLPGPSQRTIQKRASGPSSSTNIAASPVIAH